VTYTYYYRSEDLSEESYFDVMRMMLPELWEQVLSKVKLSTIAKYVALQYYNLVDTVDAVLSLELVSFTDYVADRACMAVFPFSYNAIVEHTFNFYRSSAIQRPSLTKFHFFSGSR
jgi:hypothetical protein